MLTEVWVCTTSHFNLLIRFHNLFWLLELSSSSPSELEAQVRQKVKQVLRCDVRLENPFHPQTMEPADCVTTSLCLEAACSDMGAYKKALGGLASLLKPAGVLVMVGVLGESFYCVSQTRFSCLQLTKESVEAELQNLGLTIQEFNVLSAPEEEDNEVSDYSAVFHIVALKGAGNKPLAR